MQQGWQGWWGGRGLSRGGRVTFVVAPPRVLDKSLAGMGVHRDQGMVLPLECHLYSLLDT